MLINQNIVLAARRFQPSVVGEYWLMTNQIVTSVFGNRVCTDVLSNNSSAHFDLTVIQGNATFSLKPTAEHSVVLESVRRFVRAMPDPEYMAIGFNFTYGLTSDGADVRAASQRFRFSPECTGIHDPLTVWGTVAFSPSLHGSVLRTQVMPDFPENNASRPPARLVADFNVNFNIVGQPEAALPPLEHFEECARHVCEIQSRLFQ